MNSWEIIKEHFVQNQKQGTFGYLIKVEEASRLLVKLYLAKRIEEEALNDFDKDEEVKQAILSAPKIKEMRDAGVIQ